MHELVDTHCHIHFPDYELDPNEVIKNATGAGVSRLICVGCTLTNSKLGIEMAAKHENIWATIGLHPHEAKEYVNSPGKLQSFRDLAKKYATLSHRASSVSGPAGKQAGAVRKLVAIGEAGLDYHYMHSSKEDQKKLLRFQIDLAVEHDLALIFHIREAYPDFWQIFDEYKDLRGVVHSFSATTKELNEALERGLYIGLNGIMTFTKNAAQIEAARKVPLQKLLLETDSPFLTPVPYRGTINEPKHVETIAAFLAGIRGETLARLANATTANSINLFRLE